MAEASSTFPQYNGVIMARHVNRSRGSGDSARRAKTLRRSLLKQPAVGAEREASRSAPKIGHRRSQNPTIRTRAGQRDRKLGVLTCGFWVELRGFEPLTPSMRTR